MCAMSLGSPIPGWPWPNWSRPQRKKPVGDFSLIDPMTKDFLAATEGHSPIVNFSTVPHVAFQDGQARHLSR